MISKFEKQINLLKGQVSKDKEIAENMSKLADAAKMVADIKGAAAKHGVVVPVKTVVVVPKVTAKPMT